MLLHLLRQNKNNLIKHHNDAIFLSYPRGRERRRRAEERQRGKNDREEIRKEIFKA